MPQSLLHHFRIYFLLKHQDRGGMPQIVETDVRQSCPLQEILELPEQIAALGEDQVVLPPAIASEKALLLLTIVMLTQLIQCGRP